MRLKCQTVPVRIIRSSYMCYKIVSSIQTTGQQLHPSEEGPGRTFQTVTLQGLTTAGVALRNEYYSSSICLQNSAY